MLRELYLLIAFCLAAIATSSVVSVDWVSSPLRPGEIALVSGGGFSNDQVVSLESAVDGSTINVTAFDVSASSLKFTMPTNIHAPDTLAPYDLSIGDSSAIPINTPEVWWWQGDQGNLSSPGGWLRVFGRCMSPSPINQESVGVLESQLVQATREGEFDRARTLLQQLQEARKRLEAHVGSTMLRLIYPNGTGVLLKAFNSSEYDASFSIPDALPPGPYRAEVSTGLASPRAGLWFPLQMFAGPDRPRLSAVSVALPRHWKQDVFTVDCQWHKDLFDRPCGWVGTRSSAQVDAALAKAKSNGGGVVYLPRGQYYVDGPLIIPDGVVLKGEGTNLVSIYFAEDNPETSPKPGYIHANNSAIAWAVTDLTVYVTHHYWSVFYVEPTCQDWTLQRVRVRAVAWAFLGDPDKGAHGRGNHGGTRLANFSRSEVGEVIYLDGCNNYKIFDNDLLGTAIIIHTGGHGLNHGGAATNGIVARNTIWNANAAHWFDDIKQVIFEHNTVRPAGTEMVWGNNVDNYSEGYCQHVFHAHNLFQHVYAGDREMMTFDPVNGAYFGHVTVEMEDQPLLHLLPSPQGNGSVSASFLGGMVSVLDGTGAGQYRRLVELIDSTTIRIDRAFTTPLDETSLVQVGPFKGRFVFHSNTYVDGGTFQLYANAADVIVADHHFERMEGLLSWGRASGGGVYCPNLRVQFMDNVFHEGNHLWNYNGSYPYPHPKTVEPYSIGCLASDQDDAKTAFQGPLNHLVVIKRNHIHNNGGIVVRGHTTNVLVENNAITNSSVSVHVESAHTSHVFVKHLEDFVSPELDFV